MITITVTVETKEQSEDVLDALKREQLDGYLEFAFETKVDVDRQKT
jgi:hypothetical protein